MPPPSTGLGFYARAQNFFFYLGVVYAVLIALLATPPVQRFVFYGHKFRWPLFANYDLPEAYGLAPGKTLNLHLNTPDNVTLGAWFVLSDPYYQRHRSSAAEVSPTLPSSAIRDAVRSNPTILFLHGTGGTRALPTRMQFYSQATSRLQANVLALDYRGFGDSTGVPTEEGLGIDAYTAWKWIIEQGAREEDVLVVGHSLGTNVATRLGKQLALEGVKPRGVALLAPFSELAVLLETYPVLRMPILQPITNFHMGRRLIKALTLERYDTLSDIEHLNVPVLLAHATDDPQIKHTHSKTLLDKLMDPYLPKLGFMPSNPGAPLTEAEFETYKESLRKRNDARALLVKQAEIPNFGVVEEFETNYGKVVYVEAMWGGHDVVGLQEGVQDQIAKMFSLGSYS
ncbi:alpha/beta-hydrolase [Cristinia sonorae]|uniref:Alpha/beta-hydrolase n=1 Tax=Cristinia sonorae TaxID=1940300 RepID=A0A8K0XSE6_9AGAR|nr:alpha/beta-hydrolase [Cristinia sonorae]